MQVWGASIIALREVAAELSSRWREVSWCATEAGTRLMAVSMAGQWRQVRWVRPERRLRLAVKWSQLKLKELSCQLK